MPCIVGGRHSKPASRTPSNLERIKVSPSSSSSSSLVASGNGGGYLHSPGGKGVQQIRIITEVGVPLVSFSLKSQNYGSELLTGRSYEAESCAILLLLRCSFRWYPFWPKSKFSDFGQKPWTIIRRFYRNRGDFLRSFYSTVEGATKLKFSHHAPLEMAFHMVSFLAKVKIFRFWPKTMDYNKAFLPKSR